MNSRHAAELLKEKSKLFCYMVAAETDGRILQKDNERMKELQPELKSCNSTLTELCG